MTHTTESLIERLRATLSWLPGTQIVIDTMQEAADALEARDRRIAELERTQYGSGILEQLRAKLDKEEEECDALEATVRQYVRNFNEVEDERDILRAQLDALRGQEEVAYLYTDAQSGEQEASTDPDHYTLKVETGYMYKQALFLSARCAGRSRSAAQLAELQSGDELPELPNPAWNTNPEKPENGCDGYTKGQLQTYARKAQAMTRAKLLAELEKVEAVAVADGTFNHNCQLGTPLYTRPLPAQDVNVELAYNKVDRFLRNNLGDDDYAEYSEALDTLANAKAAQQKEQK